MTRPSRRRFLAGTSGAGLPRLLHGEASGRRVLALIGDRYHNADYIQVALTRMFDGLGVSVDYTINYASLSSKLLSQYQVFVCLRDGMIWPDGYLGRMPIQVTNAGWRMQRSFRKQSPGTGCGKNRPWL